MKNHTRRNFFNKVSGLLAGTGVLSALAPSAVARIRDFSEQKGQLSAETLASDESYWQEVQKAFSVNPDFVNLENGYYSLMAEPVTTAQVDDLRMIIVLQGGICEKAGSDTFVVTTLQIACFPTASVKPMPLA